MRKVISFILVLLILALGIFMLFPHKKALAPSGDLDYKNASYDIDGQKVTLVNGKSEVAIPNSSAKIVTTYFGNETKGDINGDGKDDVVFLLTQQTGGSGTFYYVALALKTDTGYNGKNAILLGDRIAPQSSEMKDGVVTVNYADRLPNEPFSVAPSQGVSRYFKFENGNFVEIKGEMGDSTD